jgi:hypothetical protein
MLISNSYVIVTHIRFMLLQPPAWIMCTVIENMIVSAYFYDYRKITSVTFGVAMRH